MTRRPASISAAACNRVSATQAIYLQMPSLRCGVVPLEGREETGAALSVHAILLGDGEDDDPFRSRQERPRRGYRPCRLARRLPGDRDGLEPKGRWAGDEERPARVEQRGLQGLASRAFLVGRTPDHRQIAGSAIFSDPCGLIADLAAPLDRNAGLAVGRGRARGQSVLRAEGLKRLLGPLLALCGLRLQLADQAGGSKASGDVRGEGGHDLSGVHADMEKLQMRAEAARDVERGEEDGIVRLAAGCGYENGFDHRSSLPGNLLPSSATGCPVALIWVNQALAAALSVI